MPQRRVRTGEIEEWLDHTHDADPKVRSNAVHTLCPCNVKANDDRIWERFFEMVGDDHVKVRGAILHALGDGSPRALEQRVVDAVARLAADPDPKLSKIARRVLDHYRRTGVINIL